MTTETLQTLLRVQGPAGPVDYYCSYQYSESTGPLYYLGPHGVSIGYKWTRNGISTHRPKVKGVPGSLDCSQLRGTRLYMCSQDCPDAEQAVQALPWEGAARETIRTKAVPMLVGSRYPRSCPALTTVARPDWHTIRASCPAHPVCQASQDNTRTELLEALAMKGFHSLPHTGTTSPHSTPQDISSASPHCTARPPAESHSGAAAAAAAGSPCNRGYCSAGPACCEAAHLGTHWTWGGGGGQVSCLPLTPGSIPGTIRTLGLLHKSKAPCQVAKAQHLINELRQGHKSFSQNTVPPHDLDIPPAGLKESSETGSSRNSHHGASEENTGPT